jgi:transcriptional regulator with XRE-family HTH domain
MNPDVSRVGESLRRIRVQRRLSLSDVAGKAGVSVATLSRIETNKQNLDVTLLSTLAGVLGVSLSEVFGERESDGADALMKHVSRLRRSERARLLFAPSRHRDSRGLRETIEDLLSTVDVLRDELLSVQRGLRSKRKR